jgi:hypothetical protein
MANYILINFGKFPNYVSSTVQAILECEDKPNIYLCSDFDIDHLNIKSKYVDYINLNEIKSSTVDELKELDIYNQSRTSTLLNTSLWRVFILRDLVKFLKLSSFIHFDNDVLVYEPFTSFSSFLDIKKNYITKYTSHEFIFGYMYCGDINSFDKLLNEMFTYLTRRRFLMQRKIRLKLTKYLLKLNPLLADKLDNSFNFNEMNILYKINKKVSYIDSLQTIPHNNSEFIFDPCDYGFLLDGHPYESGVSNIYEKNIVGSYLITNKPKIIFKNNKPKLVVKNKTYNIVNLHIHSKNLDGFIFNSLPPIFE